MLLACKLPAGTMFMTIKYNLIPKIDARHWHPAILTTETGNRHTVTIKTSDMKTTQIFLNEY